MGANSSRLKIIASKRRSMGTNLNREHGNVKVDCRTPRGQVKSQSPPDSSSPRATPMLTTENPTTFAKKKTHGSGCLFTMSLRQRQEVQMVLSAHSRRYR